MSVGMADEFTSFDKSAVIKVCGIGGGGGNAVGRMIEAGLKDVEFITINTDSQALRNSTAGTRLQIGSAGLGAGARPEIAEQAAREEEEHIAEVLQGADMIFLTAGLGGGTGTGATPIVAEVAQSTGALTVAIVTLPFAFEGGERMANAQRGLDALQHHVDAMIVIPNDRLSLLCQTNISFLNAFGMANEVLHDGVRAISELITVTGLINLDFADVRTIMKSSGRALMGIGTAEGENRAVAAAEKAIICPLLENSTIEGATRVIVNILGGNDIGMKEVHDAVSTVQQAAHPSANIIFGAVVDEQERSELKVTVIAAGFIEAPARVLPFTHPQLIRKAQEPAVSSSHAADAPTQEPNAPAKAPAMSNVAPTPAPASATMPEPVSSPIRHTQANPAKPEQEPARRPVSPVQNPAKEVPTPVTKPQNSQAAPAQAAPRPDPNQPRPRIKVPQAAVSGKEPMPVLPEAIDEWMEDDIPPVQIMFPIAPDAEEANPADEIEDEEDISIPTFIRNRMSSPSR